MDTSQNIYDNPEFFKGYIALRQNPHSANEMLEKPALFSLAPVLDGKRVLDLGCGCGENCAEFFRRGAASVTGLDISENMLSVARAEQPNAVCAPTYVNFRHSTSRSTSYSVRWRSIMCATS